MVLLGAVLGLCIHYGSALDDRWPYPGSGEIDDDYGEYVGEKTLLWATVERVDRAEGTARVTTDYPGGTLPMEIRDFDAAVRPGGSVQVYGTLGPDRTLVADRVVVVNPAGTSPLYKYATSLVGALLVLVLFFRNWRIKPRELSVEAR